MFRDAEAVVFLEMQKLIENYRISITIKLLCEALDETCMERNAKRLNSHTRRWTVGRVDEPLGGAFCMSM